MCPVFNAELGANCTTVMPSFAMKDVLLSSCWTLDSVAIIYSHVRSTVSVQRPRLHLYCLSLLQNVMPVCNSDTELQTVCLTISHSLRTNS